VNTCGITLVERLCLCHKHNAKDLFLHQDERQRAQMNGFRMEYDLTL